LTIVLTEVTFYKVDEEGHLYISPAIREWSPVADLGIDTVIDMDAGLDECIPTTPEGCLYIYFPIYDEELPTLSRLDAVGTLGAQLIRTGHRVLSHCGMGFNRSALVAGVILNKLGVPGREAVSRIRERRPGALFNDVFAEYLASL
jgi:protein-tyrosine phosphatase